MRTRILAIILALTSLPLAASITGVVINTDGQPVTGANVALYAPETVEARRTRLTSATPDRTALATATSDSKGNFKIDPPQGQRVVILAVQANGFAPEGIRLLADDDAGAIALSAAPMKRGTITANGKPLAGAEVVWIGSNADLVAKTDAEGHYSVPDPSKWANQVIVFHPDFAVVDEVSAPRMTPRIDYALNAGVAVSGKVLAADGKSGVAKAPVLIDEIPLAVTADDGTFTIAHAPSNWQEAQARSGSFAGVRARGANGAVNIRMASIAKVAGVVRDPKTLLPIAGAEVRLGPEMMAMGRRQMRAFSAMGGAAVESALTDAKGNFSLTAPAGHYTLSAIFPGSSIAQTQISLTAGQSLNKNMFATTQARVSGTVVDEERRPIGGARLSVDVNRRRGGPGIMLGPIGGLETSGYSAPDGRFTLRSVMPDADVQIDAVKKGFPSAESASMKLASGERKSGVTITIPRGVALSGRVTDANGKPVSGVRVDPVQAEGGMRGPMVRRVINMMQRERTDDLVSTGSDGTFTVRVKPGTYDVVFKREGFATKILHGTSIDAAAKPVEVKLDPSVEISGRVVRNGAGVEGVMVNAMSEEGPATTTTNSDGSFTLTDLTPGQMMLNVMKPDAFIQQIRPVTAPASNITIELPAGGRITGRVVDKSTHNPVTSFEAGISFQRGAGGMMIALPPMLKDFTSDDGSFTLENIPPGPTQLVVTAPGYTTAHIPGLNVEDGKVLDNVEVALDTGVRLTGRVTGPDGSPIAGVNVREDQAGMLRGPMTGAGATTDPNGEYVIDAVESGEKTFTFAHQGYLSVDKTITLSGREARLDVQLGAGITVAGTVVTDAGAPVPDAVVNAISAGNSMFGNPNGRTDAGGNFQITGLAPGHYMFMARKDGVGQGQQRDVDITTQSPHIVIPAGGTIVGHVTGLTDTELQNVIVMANSNTGSASAAPDATGAYRIDGAPTGSVHVSARTARGFGPGGKNSGIVAVQVDPGATATADIQFKGSTVISGRVTRNGQPMSNVMVGFNPRGGPGTSSSGTTDSNGSYSITGLDDGTYNVAVVDIDRSNAFSSAYEVHGSGTFDIDIKTASLQGSVVDASTGEPIAAAQIQLQNQGGGFMGSRFVQSDPSGAFFVDNVARGTYHIVVQKDGYGHQMQDITVGDTPPDALQFKLAPSSGVTIAVVDARDNRPITANATRIVDASGQVVTAGGVFTMSGSPEPIKLTLAPGAYTVTITASGYATKVMSVTSPSNITVALTPGVTIQLRSKGSAPARARLVDGSGATIRGFTLDPSPMLTTLNNIAPGNYTLQVLDNNGNVVKTVPVTVVGDSTPVIDV